MRELELDILGSVMLGFHKIYSNVPTHDTLTNLQARNSLSKCKQVMLKAITFLGVLTLVVLLPSNLRKDTNIQTKQATYQVTRNMCLPIFCLMLLLPMHNAGRHVLFVSPPYICY